MGRRRPSECCCWCLCVLSPGSEQVVDSIATWGSSRHNHVRWWVRISVAISVDFARTTYRGVLVREVSTTWLLQRNELEYVHRTSTSEASPALHTRAIVVPSVRSLGEWPSWLVRVRKHPWRSDRLGNTEARWRHRGTPIRSRASTAYCHRYLGDSGMRVAHIVSKRVTSVLVSQLDAAQCCLQCCDYPEKSPTRCTSPRVVRCYPTPPREVPSWHSYRVAARAPTGRSIESVAAQCRYLLESLPWPLRRWYAASVADQDRRSGHPSSPAWFRTARQLGSHKDSTLAEDMVAALVAAVSVCTRCSMATRYARQALWHRGLGAIGAVVRRRRRHRRPCHLAHDFDDHYDAPLVCFDLPPLLTPSLSSLVWRLRRTPLRRCNAASNSSKEQQPTPPELYAPIHLSHNVGDTIIMTIWATSSCLCTTCKSASRPTIYLRRRSAAVVPISATSWASSIVGAPSSPRIARALTM